MFWHGPARMTLGILDVIIRGTDSIYHVQYQQSILTLK
jgi:hypothetical protein